MRIFLSLLLLSLFNVNLLAQKKTTEISPEEVLEAFEEAFEEIGEGVYIQVDTTLFPKRFGGVYISSWPRATLMSKVKLGKLGKLEKTLPKSQKKGKISHIDNGYLEHNDRKILYHIGYRIDKEGVKMRVDTYVYQATPSTLVYIVGTYVDGLTDYENATIKAAFTAKYIEPKK